MRSDDFQEGRREGAMVGVVVCMLLAMAVIGFIYAWPLFTPVPLCLGRLCIRR